MNDAQVNRIVRAIEHNSVGGTIFVSAMLIGWAVFGLSNAHVRVETKRLKIEQAAFCETHERHKLCRGVEKANDTARGE